jgi:hypothetical protein
MSRTRPLFARPLMDAARAVVQDCLRAPARAPPAVAPVGRHVLALDVSAFPTGAVIRHLRVDRTAAAVANENCLGGSYSTTEGQLYQQWHFAYWHEAFPRALSYLGRHLLTWSLRRRSWCVLRPFSLLHGSC